MNAKYPSGGKEINIYSTPKLVQHMYRENIISDRDHIVEILSAGSSGKIVVLGTQIYDIHNKEISLNAEQLAQQILTPNAINIVF